MKHSNPSRALVRAEISIHDALDAIEHFAANYDPERLPADFHTRLHRAASLASCRALKNRIEQVFRKPKTEMILAPLPAGVPDTPEVRAGLQALCESPIAVHTTSVAAQLADAEKGC